MSDKSILPRSAPNGTGIISPFLFILLVFLAPALPAASPKAFEDVKVSSKPLGSPFYRHLAFDMGVDLEDLVPFENKGFGRSEIVTIVLLSKITGTPLKDYGKRRIREKISLEKLAKEAGLDYDTFGKVVREIKKGIESKGKNNLPPAVYPKKPGQKDQKP